jgi:hypothetical protein
MCLYLNAIFEAKNNSNDTIFLPGEISSNALFICLKDCFFNSKFNLSK